MKSKLKALFATLDAKSRARYYSTYLSVLNAIEEGDIEVIPHLFEFVIPGADTNKQTEFLNAAKEILQAGDR